MKEHLIEFFSQFPPEVATFLLAMVPVTELRASIPVAITVYDMSPVAAFVYSVLGNVAVGAIVLAFGEKIVALLIARVAPLRRLWERYIERIKTKNVDRFDRWGAWALVLFVAIPLPMTGIVTGAVAASIFQIPWKRAISLLALGAVIAGIAVTMLTLAVVNGVNG